MKKAQLKIQKHSFFKNQKEKNVFIKYEHYDLTNNKADASKNWCIHGHTCLLSKGALLRSFWQLGS